MVIGMMTLKNHLEYHQNIRGIKGKITIPLFNEAPNLICLTEHHLTDHEIDVTHIPKYKLDAKFCRKKLKNGGVCIYIQEGFDSRPPVLSVLYK
jgi:hypothetical protein